jgi:GH15 family glucan-1,4-alpha-glucosidase
MPHVLRDYALIADGERGALVGPRGDIPWLCFPAWDGEPAFAGLLGGHGHYVVRPTERFVWGGRYDEGGLVWWNRWIVGGDVVECQNALAFPGRPDTAILVRRVVARRGPAEVAVRLAPEHPAQLHRAGDTCWELPGPVRWRWQCAVPATERDGGLEAVIRLDEGDEADLVLELTNAELSPSPAIADEVLRATGRAWSNTVSEVTGGLAPRDVRHSVAVLRGMTASSHGLVAAAVTSLPERADRGRNYDYRYAWLRDQCYAGLAGASAGGAALGLVEDAVAFVHERLLEDGPELRPAYRCYGGRVPPERHVDLPGYPGAPDVVFGNRAGAQFQLDVFGESLLLFAAASQVDRMHGDAWRAARIAAEAVERRWQEADAGVWELEPRRYTHSRLVSAAGLRAMAGAGPEGPESRRWLGLADAIVAEVAASSVHPSGRWQRAPDDDRCDAALLLGGIRGAVPPDDPRTLATLEAVKRDLTVDHYVYRFRESHEPLGLAEGAFLLCGFWLALACDRAGDRFTAARCFERNRAACGPPGLLSEEYDVEQRQQRGNLPQSFVHALLIEASCTLAQEETR